MRPSTLFFWCQMPEESITKAGFEVQGRSLCPVFDWERNTPSRQNLFVHECIQATFKLQVKGLLTWVRKGKQIYIHAYIHTHTIFVKQFQETRRAPGLKITSRTNTDIKKWSIVGNEVEG